MWGGKWDFQFEVANVGSQLDGAGVAPGAQSREWMKDMAPPPGQSWHYCDQCDLVTSCEVGLVKHKNKKHNPNKPFKSKKKKTKTLTTNNYST